MSCTSQMDGFVEVIWDCLKSKYRSRCTKVPQNVFLLLSLLDGFNKEMALFVSP
jgi:hypothetical protein